MNDKQYHLDAPDFDEPGYTSADITPEGGLAASPAVEASDFEYVPREDASTYAVEQATDELRLPSTQYDSLQIDIDSALAAVTSLDDLLVEPISPAPPKSVRPAKVSPVDVPPTLKLGRGNPLSVVTGLVSMGVGGWLTYQWTAGQPVPAPTLTVLLALIPISFFLVGWLWSGRWSRGVFVVGMSLSAFSVAQYYAPRLQWTGMAWVAYGFFTFGVILVLVGILSRPFTLRTLYNGLVFAVIGAVVRVVEYDYLPLAWIESLRKVWYVPLGVFALMMILPFFRRRNPR